ncbi:UbiA family prenyltransferase [Methanobacterium sp.]|uniref:UbiA family prenyltransferase n=1 Tax=Methanobacterium sp. TaxID=2164 RepID=UPI003C707E4F
MNLIITAPKIKAIIQLIRVDLSFAAGICVVIGEIVAFGGFPSIYSIIFGFIVGFFVSTSALILNDYFDIEIDKINVPTRPLPSGIIKPYEVILLSMITTLIGLTAAFFIGYIVLVVAIVFWIIGFLYNWKFKRTGLPGNLMVSSSVAVTFILGGIVVGKPWSAVVWCFSIIAFFIDLGEEIASDAMDMAGDAKINSRSIALSRGKDRALKIAGVSFVLVVFVSFIPVIFSWLGTAYLVMIIFMDALIIFSTYKLLKSQTLEEGRRYTRIIYLGATLGLIGFIIGQILI